MAANMTAPAICLSLFWKASFLWPSPHIPPKLVCLHTHLWPPGGANQPQEAADEGKNSFGWPAKMATMASQGCEQPRWLPWPAMAATNASCDHKGPMAQLSLMEGMRESLSLGLTTILSHIQHAPKIRPAPWIWNAEHRGEKDYFFLTHPQLVHMLLQGKNLQG